MQPTLLLLSALVPAALADNNLGPVARAVMARATTAASSAATPTADAACSSVALEAYSIYTNVPAPTGDAVVSYAMTVSDTNDPCALIAAAPSAAQSELKSYQSALSSAFASHKDVVTSLASCASSMNIPEASAVTEVLAVATCGAKNAGPRETAAAGLGFVAAAAAIGIVGLL